MVQAVDESRYGRIQRTVYSVGYSLQPQLCVLCTLKPGDMPS